jgi:hypothetical protein
MCNIYLFIYLPFLDSPSGSRPFHCWGFEIKLRHTTLSRTSLDEWSARRRKLYLTTQTLTRERHPCPRRDSNPQSQEASGRRTTHLIGRPLRSATNILIAVNLCCIGHNVHVVSNNAREVLCTASSLSRKTLYARTPVRCLEIVVRICVADFCMFDRRGHHSYKVFCKKWLNVKVFRFAFSIGLFLSLLNNHRDVHSYIVKSPLY